MGNQYFLLDEEVFCFSCGRVHRVSKKDNGGFVCQKCGVINSFGIDAFPEDNMEAVLGNATRMSKEKIF